MDRPGILRRALVGGGSLLALVIFSGGSVERNSLTGPASVARQDSSAVVAAVGRFHSALAAGDTAAALALLATDAIIVESGAVQTRREYRAHHLAADVEFTRAVPPFSSDPAASVRATAAESLGMLGQATSYEIEDVAALATDPDASVRRAAIQSLAGMGAKPFQILSAARPALSDSSASVRIAAAYALWRLGPRAVPALSELIKALDDRESAVREGAALAIGSIGSAGRSAVPNLKKLLADSSRFVAERAREAIASVDGRVSR